MLLEKLTLDVSGAVWIDNPASPGTPLHVVYQGTGNQFANYLTGLKKPRQRRAYVIPIDPMTTPQLARRHAMRLAVAAWHAADTATREQARSLADRRQITLYMAFVSAYVKAYVVPPGTPWDGYTTAWDAGATVWDNPP